MHTSAWCVPECSVAALGQFEGRDIRGFYVNVPLTLMRRGAVALVRHYQRGAALDRPARCRYRPTCSTYFIEVLDRAIRPAGRRNARHAPHPALPPRPGGGRALAPVASFSVGVAAPWSPGTRPASDGCRHCPGRTGRTDQRRQPSGGGISRRSVAAVSVEPVPAHWGVCWEPSASLRAVSRRGTVAPHVLHVRPL